MDVRHDRGEIRAVDGGKNSIRFDVPNFDPGAVGVSITDTLAAVDTGPPTPAATIGGTARRIEFQPVFVKVIELDGDRRRSFGNGQESMTLPDGEYLVRIHGNVRAFVRFSGSATLRYTEENRKRLALSDPTEVSIGFESYVERPEHTITVERSVAGAAKAVSWTSATTINTSPDRSWPTQRNLPPRIEFGPDGSVPQALRQLRPDTGVEFLLPEELAYVLVTAPLAHYLGARVRTEPEATPRMELDGKPIELPPLPATQAWTSDTLQRTFYFDCIARGAGPHGGDLAVGDVFDETGLDAAELYEASVSERVRTYLGADFEAVRHRLPEWHLAMYIDPRLEHVPTLPHVLSDLPIVRLPESTELSQKELLDLSFEDGFEESPEELRATTRGESDVDLVEPTLAEATNHGWMAENVPIDVFKTFPEAYENRLDYLDRGESELKVTAVVNERDLPLLLSDDDETQMQDEHEAALEHYQRRAEELPIDIAVRENVTCAELARIFESHNDFVHYIGHREDSGLECSNGYFDMSTVEQSRTQTFFINACGSYPDGRELIQKGSVAGGITYERVADGAAANVGTTFARTIMQGFGFDRALRIASRMMMTPKDYAVVGDGTHVLTQSDSLSPTGVWLFDEGDGYQLVKKDTGPNMPGLRTSSRLDDQYHLSGAGRSYSLSKDELVDYLEYLDSPIIYDDDLYWPEELPGVL